MDAYSILKDILTSHHVEQFGICDFKAISHFLPSRKINEIPPHATSVIVLAIPYLTETTEQTNLCRYAQVPDYHIVVGELLASIIEALKRHFSNDFVGFSDISVLPEKECATLAGLGFIGKHSLVINPLYGSYFVIGEIVTDLSLPFSVPIKEQCQSCDACVRHCPAQALTNGMEPTLCLSAITQKKGELSPQEQALIKQNKLAWGCDVCQQVCPHNKTAKLTHFPQFYENIELTLTKENLPVLKKSRAFGWRGEKVLLRNLDLLEEDF